MMRWFVYFLSTAVVGSGLGKEPPLTTTAPSQLPAKGVNGWPNVAFTRVEGFQFETESDKKNAFGFLTGSEPRLGELKNHVRAQAMLSVTQTERLLVGVFDSTENQVGSRCYNPHHIFVFYAADLPVAAVEVCFECKGVRTWPSVPTGLYTNYADIERLSKELRLGTGAPPTPGNKRKEAGR
jgi:hypothetical protein